MLRAQLRADGEPRYICIGDISSRGMLIRAARPPARGSYVEITCAGQIFVGRVVWTKADRFGVFTQDPMNVRAVVGHGRKSKPARPASSDSEDSVVQIARQTAAIGADSERSRHVAQMLQFGAIAVALAVTILLIADEIHDFLLATANSLALR